MRKRGKWELMSARVVKRDISAGSFQRRGGRDGQEAAGNKTEMFCCGKYLSETKEAAMIALVDFPEGFPRRCEHLRLRSLQTLTG